EPRRVAKVGVLVGWRLHLPTGSRPVPGLWLTAEEAEYGVGLRPRIRPVLPVRPGVLDQRHRARLAQAQAGATEPCGPLPWGSRRTELAFQPSAQLLGAVHAAGDVVADVHDRACPWLVRELRREALQPRVP